MHKTNHIRCKYVLECQNNQVSKKFNGHNKIKVDALNDWQFYSALIPSSAGENSPIEDFTFPIFYTVQSLSTWGDQC